MSHIAKFNLSITDETALRRALENLGCTITDGQMKTYYNGMSATVPDGEHRGKPVAFGFSFNYKGRNCDRFGFVKNNAGEFELIGDSYGYGIQNDVTTNILENMYVNTRVDLNVVPMLESLGFVEDMSQTEANLQTFA